MSRIGIFGSSFDPPHLAHLAMARTALGWGLDAVWWMPAAVPPHKQGQVTAGSDDRRALVALAIEGESQMRLEPLELERGGVSYTCDSLQVLRERWPTHEWFLMMGEDTWLTLGTWKAIEEFPQWVQFMVFGREETEPGPTHPFPHLPGVIRFPAFDMPISSRQIREQIAGGSDLWRAQVPQQVAEYIEQHGLYGIRKAALQTVTESEED